jgi:membrane protein required for beta-lactamase induction
MNFLALLLGLGVERLLTHLFHLREFRWLDPLFDRGFARITTTKRGLAMAGVAVLAIVIVLPVAVISILLQDKFVQIPYFVFAVLVLLFSLGPRDLAEEANDYCTAVENDATEEAERTGKELLERKPPIDEPDRSISVERAIYIQANNRIFGVVLWFVLLGPTGAWLFRVLDLMRRRAAYQSVRASELGTGPKTVVAIETLHGIFAWLPARLLMVGYALAGSFDGATKAWRTFYAHRAERFFDLSSDLLGNVGHGALGDTESIDSDKGAAERAKAAMGLVWRTLWLIWCPILAVLTLYDWLL